MNERELFIAQYKKYVNNCADFTILNETENTFHDDAVDEAWVMWQLSANREGYKLVPIEPTREQKLSVYNNLDYYEGDKLLCDIYKAMTGAVDES